MAQALELMINCPQCGTEFSREAHTLIDMGDAEDAANLELLKEAKLNYIACPNCGADGLIPIPLALHNPQEEYLMVFVPGVTDMDEQELAEALNPVLETFLEAVPPDELEQKPYLFNPLITDDFSAILAASRGEITAADLVSANDLDGDDEDDEDEDGNSLDSSELSTAERAELMERIQFVGALVQAPDSLARIAMLRENPLLLDDLLLEVVDSVQEQATENAQPELAATLGKLSSEVQGVKSSLSR